MESKIRSEDPKEKENLEDLHADVNIILKLA
jgi:hypothetical protein